MKLRLLNGSHSALAYISALVFSDDANVTVDRAVMDPDIRNFICAYMSEVAPTLGGGPEGEDRLNEYRESLLSRFGNHDISDLVSRLCQDGSKKVQGFLVPPLQQLMRAGKDTKIVQKVIASWYVYLRDWKGEIDDPAGEKLVDLARSGRLEEFLASGVGHGVGTAEAWAAGVKSEVQFLDVEGPRAFLRDATK